MAVIGLSVWLHARTMIHAGGLWRDEVNSANIATLPTLSDVWAHLRYDSFPVLWFLVLKAGSSLGLNGDSGLRWIGFLVGIGLLASVCVTGRLLRCRVPLLALALVSCNAVMIQWGDSLRAWGLGAALIVMTFGLIWRVVETPTRKGMTLALVFSVMSVHTIYYNSVLLFAICVAGAVVAFRRSARKGGITVLAIGLMAAITLLPYLPSMQAVRESQNVLENPRAGLPWFLDMLRQTLEVSGPQLSWIWLALGLGALIFAITFLIQRRGAARNVDYDRVLFATVALVVGVVGYFLFLKIVGYSTSYWYYIALLAFGAIGMEMIYSVLPDRTPWRITRVLFVLAIVAMSLPTAFGISRERRTNVDVIAAELARQAHVEDFIIVDSWLYGITFARYFTGETAWETVPPLPDHRVHRYDLIKELMQANDSSEPMTPMLQKIEATLKAGRRIWIVGGMDIPDPDEGATVLPAAPGSPYGWFVAAYEDVWSEQVGHFVYSKAEGGGKLVLPDLGPVTRFEELPVILIEGWRASAAAE